MSEEDSYLQAMDSYNQKDFEKAKPLLQDFYNNFKDSKYRPNVMLKLAELETDFSKQEAMYKEIIKEKPDTEFEAEAVYSLGRLYFARDEFRKKRRIYGHDTGEIQQYRMDRACLPLPDDVHERAEKIRRDREILRRL